MKGYDCHVGILYFFPEKMKVFLPVVSVFADVIGYEFNSSTPFI